MDKLSFELRTALIEAELVGEFDPHLLSVYPFTEKDMEIVQVVISSDKFTGKTPYERVKMVFDVLGQFKNEILMVTPYAPNEMVDILAYSG